MGVVRTFFTDPLVVLGALVECHDFVYLIWLGLPLLFLFLLSPGLAAVGASAAARQRAVRLPAR